RDLGYMEEVHSADSVAITALQAKRRGLRKWMQRLRRSGEGSHAPLPDPACRTLWVDVNEGLDFAGATRLLHAIVERVARGALPPRIVVEGPLPKADGLLLPDLQRQVDRLVEERDGHGRYDIPVMPDESIWDRSDLEAWQ